MQFPFSMPRLRLKTLLLLFFCAAVGLATYPNPLDALGPAIAAAMVVGLIQQSHQIASWQPRSELSEDQRFARRFAIGWRVVLFVAFAAGLVTQMLLARQVLMYPERADLVFYEPLTDAFIPLCGVVVLCSSLARWRSSSQPVKRSIVVIGMLAAACAMVMLIVLVDSTAIEALTHRAVQGIEASIPEQFRRPGIYPNLADEGYRTLWLAFAALVCLAAATALLCAISAHARTIGAETFAKFSFLAILLLSPPVMFCYWYYTHEFYRLSPELAGAGIVRTSVDWVVYGAVVLILVTAGAYKFGQKKMDAAAISADLGEDLENQSLHESVWCLVPLCFSVFYQLSLQGIALVGAIPLLQQLTRKPSLASYLNWICDPISLLLLATAIATFQLCWVRWKNRARAMLWQLDGLSQPEFFFGWGAFALLLIVAVPTLHAFAFVIWLGPIDLQPLLGF